jgi:flavodoxin
MDVLITYGSQYGNTQRIAERIGRALEPEHDVRVMQAALAADVTGDDVDLLFVGAPTQMRGLRVLAKPFLSGLEARGFRGVAAAAFDTRLDDIGPKVASDVIANHLVGSGCRLIAEPESFLVLDTEGPLAPGEEERAAGWARAVARVAAGVDAR